MTTLNECPSYVIVQTDMEFECDSLVYTHIHVLTLVLLIQDIPAFTNSVDSDQLASEEANWSRSALFVINWLKIWSGCGILIYSEWQGLR